MPRSSTRLRSPRRARFVALLLGATALYGAFRASAFPELAGALFVSGSALLVVAFFPRSEGRARTAREPGPGGG